MSNRKSIALMTVALIFVWAVTLGLESAGIPDVRKIASIVTFAILGCMFGAFLHFIAKRLY